jgi:hypothetical protein
MRAGAASAAALLAAVAACHAPAPRGAPPELASPPDIRAPSDDSYDWHGLLIAPFGSVLKDIPLRLHEVLLFRDEAHGTPAADDAAAAAADDATAVTAECYAADAAAPRFVGRAPEEYMLCFQQNRLSRIQATVRLTAAEASDVFAAACAGWLKNAAPTADAQSAAAPAGAACEGRDGAIHFSARLEEEPALSIVLNSAPDL